MYPIGSGTAWGTTTPPIVTPVDELDQAKLSALEALKHARKSAMQKPFWPSSYDSIIKEYFR
jgi:hypothetical protein